jgi:hypothetical protein
MPRLGGGHLGQSYLLSSLSSDSGASSGGSATETITELPSIPLIPRPQSFGVLSHSLGSNTNSHSPIPHPSRSTFGGLINNSSTKLPTNMPRAPSSLKTSTSNFLNRSSSQSQVGLASSAGASGGPLSPRTLPTMRASTDSELTMPLRDSSGGTPLRPRTFLRAAESGKGTLLPDYRSSTPLRGTITNTASTSAASTTFTSSTTNSRKDPSSRKAPSRAHTRSSPSLNLVMNLNFPGRKKDSTMILPTHSSPAPPPPSQNGNHSADSAKPRDSMLQQAKQSLRRRTGTAGHSDDEELAILSNRNMRSSNEFSPYRSSSRGDKRRRAAFNFNKLLHMKIGHILQILVVLAVTVLVWESHHKALYAAEQLSQFKEEE